MVPSLDGRSIDETYLNLRWSVVGGNTLRLTTSADGSGDFVLNSPVGIQSQSEAGWPRIAAAKTVTKTGPGTIVIDAVNTYSGGTQVSAGELRVNGALGAGAVSVASDAVLGGGGVISGPVSIQRGGAIAPGNSPGTLTVTNSFTLAEGAILRFELNPTNRVSGGGVNDLITGVTNLTLDGILNVTGVGDWTTLPGNAAWRLFTYSGILTDNGVTLGAMPTLSGGQSFAIDVTTPGEVNLVVVPEPSVAALITVGLAGIAAICGAGAAKCGEVRRRRRDRWA